MDFKEKIKDSFAKIREDFSEVNDRINSVDQKISQKNIANDVFENKLNIIIKTIEANQNSIDVISNRLSSLENEIEEMKTKVEGHITVHGSMGIVPKEKSTKGKSSIGNRGEMHYLSSKGYLKRDPIVSSGTSSIGNRGVERKETKRSMKVKNEILTSAKEIQYLNKIYDAIVEEKEFCSKTSFYRFIKELENDGKIKIELVQGKRRIALL